MNSPKRNQLGQAFEEIIEICGMLWRAISYKLAALSWRDLALGWVLFIIVLTSFSLFGFLRPVVGPSILVSVIMKLIADDRKRNGTLPIQKFEWRRARFEGTSPESVDAKDAETQSLLIGTITDFAKAFSYVWSVLSDRLAVISWRRLALYWLLAMIVLLPTFGEHIGPILASALLASIAIKALASDRYRAEVRAKEADTRADVEALERRLVEAQMATLQAQIEPHFLFNTLALISQMIETNPGEAAKIHKHLIQYLRAALPQMRESGGGTLGRQVDMSRAYLAIMQARMGARLSVTFDVPEPLLSAAFPTMMLQTLVENSIKHGLEPKIEGGFVAVRAFVDGPALQVDVEDNGMGFDLHAADGIGLSNIRERLKLLYGADAHLLVAIPEKGGALVSIRVPYVANPTA